jgi:hypothetical protein
MGPQSGTWKRKLRRESTAMPDMATLVTAIASLVVSVGVLVISVGIFYLIVRLGRAIELLAGAENNSDSQSE